jgi:predicted GIY-YIG superfamily endonuclease
MPLYRIYVLRNPKAHFYIGFSENVDIRVQQHNAGMSRSTCGRGPSKIVWRSLLLTLSAARALELKLKRQKGGNGFYQITGLRRI